MPSARPRRGAAARSRFSRVIVGCLVGGSAALAPAAARAEDDAAAPRACTDPAFAACAAGEGGGTCTLEGRQGTCINGGCSNDGDFGQALECVAIAECATVEQRAPCDGKTAGESCGSGGACTAARCGTLDDGGAPLVCIFAAPGSGGGSSSTSPGTSGEVAENGEGCAVSAGTGEARLGFGSPGAGAGLLVGAAAWAERRRRARARAAKDGSPTIHA